MAVLQFFLKVLAFALAAGIMFFSIEAKREDRKTWSKEAHTEPER
jgi:hypothetical protein